MATPRYLSAEQVGKVLTWPLVNEAVEEAMKAVAGSNDDPTTSHAEQPPRSMTTCGDRSKILFTMPGYVGNFQLSSATHNTLACKLVTSFRGNDQRQPPLANILANILLFSTETGHLECIVEGTQITAWRTAAASVVATKYLYFKRGDFADRAIKVAIIGCGVQGQSHALAMCATFKVSEISLWNRTASKADALAEQLRRVSPQTQVKVAASPGAAVAEADVICVGTYSPNALVDFSMLKKSNVHINTVGAGQVHFGEIAQDIYDQGKVYIDTWASAKVELKDLKAELVAEVGEVIRSGKYPPAEGITIFQSMGMAAEDATVAQAVFEAIKCAEV